MLRTFIQRPILSAVISIFLVLLGLLAMVTLPVTQFPDIVPPSVTVTANYLGANAEVSAKAVATQLERAINGVAGMTSMNTVCSNDGRTVITVNFEVGTDPDLASVNVQNRVTSVLDELPEEVIKAGVITEKEVNSMLMYLNIASTDTTLEEEFIYNFADINILKELKRINGVGLVDILGVRDYAMRVWLIPDRLVSFKMSAQDVVDAIRAHNLEIAPGKTGESSGRKESVFQYVLRYKGKFNSEEEYLNIPIRSNEDGSILKLRDVAHVEFGSEDYSVTSKMDDRPSAAILIKQRPGSNAKEVIENVKAKMEEIKITSFPPGMNYSVSYDVSRFLDASIHELIKTLIEAFILVFLVVFIFLQDWRSTLITALAVPVALVGTFLFMQLFGFSINLLTLFALVLAIGIVVDNAIVVVEAVFTKMTVYHMGAREATFEAMQEIAAAILSITLVMTAVFVPVSFMSGPVGVFYRQFSITLAISIVISGLNALTLTPALCAILLKGSGHGSGKLSKWFNRGFDRMTDGYTGVINKMAPKRWLTALITVVAFALVAYFNGLIPKGFIPTEDQGMLYVNVTTPPGATVERTDRVMQQVFKATNGIEAIESVSTLSGYSLITESVGASFGMGMINLKTWKDRHQSVQQIVDSLNLRTEHIADAQIEFMLPPTVPGFGNASGFEFRLLDKTGADNLSRLDEVNNNLIVELENQPEIASVYSSFNTNYPQYLIELDLDIMAQKGLTVEESLKNLQIMLGSLYSSNFIKFGQLYKVLVQASPEFRAKPEDVLKMYAKNNKGEMVPYTAFCRISRVFGPEQLTRYNMYYSSMLNGEPAPGYSNGEAIEAVKRVCEKTLPAGYSYEWSGMTREEVISGNQAIFVFAICLLFVYLVLSAQYESFLIPFAVILSLAAGIAGSYLALMVFGLDNNIYAQVSLVMLVGLLGKNAILIVEFSVQKYRMGDPLIESVVEGAKERFRPILMTSFAFIGGLIPLVMAHGAGELGNKSIGASALGGMLIGTLFGVFIIPGLVVLFTKQHKPKPAPKPQSE